MSSPLDADARARERGQALVGRTLDGRYRVDAILAMGGMGAVFDARHVKLRKRVALKVLHPDVEADSELARRFEREATAGAQVSHPHVACATDFGELPDGTRFLVMERVFGETLRALLDREGRLEPPRAARIARQIAVALGAIHDRGIVHRDLKPRNVMLTPEDFVKVVDFGLAKIDGARLSTMTEEEVARDARLTAGGVVMGTFGHLAPEAAFGMEAVDARADLYALGVMAYEMIAGRHPFDAKNDLELFARQRAQDAPRFADRAPEADVPEALERVVLRLLERDPERRFASAAEVVRALDEAVPSASEPPAPPVEPPMSSLRPAPAPSEGAATEPPLRGREPDALEGGVARPEAPPAAVPSWPPARVAAVVLVAIVALLVLLAAVLDRAS